MSIKVCQYGNCMEEIGDKGITVTLRTPTFDGEKQAKFCCAFHAALSLGKLARERNEDIDPAAPAPTRWRST